MTSIHTLVWYDELTCLYNIKVESGTKTARGVISDEELENAVSVAALEETVQQDIVDYWHRTYNERIEFEPDSWRVYYVEEE